MVQFSGETNGLDLFSDALYWAKADSTSFPIKDFTRLANFALDHIISLIMKVDRVWEWDDTNNTDLPIATTSLKANQQDYGIAITHLKIIKVRIKDSAGNWVSLTPLNRRELTDSQLTATGDPKRYDKLANSIFLHPKPSYASSGGLEVQFQRGASYFVYTDTTKTPGFASQFHRLISLHAAADYCSANSMIGRVNMLQGKIQQMEEELTTFYSQRDLDQKLSLKVKKEDYGESAMGGGGSSNPNGF